MKSELRMLRRLLSAGSPPSGQLWRRRAAMLTSAMLLVRMFYVCLFLLLFECCPSWSGWFQVRALRLLWPVAWFDLTGVHTGVAVVLAMSWGGVLLSIAWPERRFCRLLAAVGLLEFSAFFNSFGVITHGWHTWFWVAAIFVLLPDGDSAHVGASVSRRERYLRVFWAGQAATLLFYSSSGAFKIAAGLYQMARGEAGTFSPEALARHTIRNMQETAFLQPGSTVGVFLVEHTWLAWPIFLGALYLEVFSFLIAFRPSVQRFWGLAMMLWHVGVYFTLSIPFVWQPLIVGLMLVCSPWAGPQSLTAMVRALPVVGDLLEMMGSWHSRRARGTRTDSQPTMAPVPARD